MVYSSTHKEDMITRYYMARVPGITLGQPQPRPSAKSLYSIDCFSIVPIMLVRYGTSGNFDLSFLGSYSGGIINHQPLDFSFARQRPLQSVIAQGSMTVCYKNFYAIESKGFNWPKRASASTC